MRDLSRVVHKSHRQRYFQIYFLKCGDNGLLQDKNILEDCVKSYFCSPVTLLGSEMHIGFRSHFRRDFWLRQSFWLFPFLDQDWLWLQLRAQRQCGVDFSTNCTLTSSALSFWKYLWKYFSFVRFEGAAHHWAPQTVFQMTGSPPPETSAPLTKLV